MKRRTICALVFFIFSSLATFADFTVISPVSGTWANKQVLLLALNEGQEAYYSINGTDPLVSGFAYDEPVTIDVSGDVEIRVVAIDSNGDKTEKRISYTVAERLPVDEKAGDFIRAFASVPVYEYTPGMEIEIPDAFYFSIGYGDPVYIPAKKISLDKDCCSVRQVPFVLTDGTSFWRGIISTKPSLGVFNRRAVPFVVENWTKISFIDKNLIYSIDGGWWQSSMRPVEVDRSVAHTIRWQTSSFEKGNPIQTFELSAKPELIKNIQSDGSVTFSVSGDGRYRIGATKDKKSSFATGIFSSMNFDVFSGDSVSENVSFAVYIDNVYQGDLADSYTLDRRPPSAPVLIPNEKASLVRKPLDIAIISEKDSVLYYATTMPVELEDGFDRYSADDSYTSSPLGKYQRLSSSSVRLLSRSEKPVFYKISVFAQDAAGNKSQATEYSVILDFCNYYFDAASDPAVADGTKEHPFTTFEKDFFPESTLKFMHFHIRGTVMMPDCQFVLPVNCKITGSNNAVLAFQNNSSILLRLISLELSNCLINMTDSSETGENKKTNALFELENAILSIDGSEIVAQFLDSGSIIQGTSSAVMLKNSGLIVQSHSYAAVVSGVDTRIQTINCRISAISQTAVDFSLHGGSLELKSSACKVVGGIGRIAELIGADYIARQNTFTGELSSGKKVQPIWKDAAVTMIEDSQNSVKGF